MLQTNRQDTIARACALASMLLGATTVAGWAFGVPALVQLRPNMTPMVVNTGIGFLLAGAALFAASRDGATTRRITAVFALLVALLAVEELCVLVFDISPAFSLPELHRPLQPDYPHPGRMAPNTALCFLLFAASMLSSSWPASPAALAWARRFGMSVLAIGLLGIVGYTLRLEYLYAWSGVVRMAIHTGAGMVVLGLGAWHLAGARTRQLPERPADELEAVHRVATVLLLLTAGCAGIGGFALLQEQIAQEARVNLEQTGDDRIDLFAQILVDRRGRARVLGDDALAVRLRALARNPGDPGLRVAQQAWAARLESNGFSSATLVVEGRTAQLMGAPSAPGFTARLRDGDPAWVIWDGGYVLRTALPLRDASGTVGTLVADQPLGALSRLGSEIKRFGRTGELAVCQEDAPVMRCFPTRMRPAPFVAPLVRDGSPLPMSHALRGERGSIVALDYRRQRVLAAYGPIGATGLGLVVKRDIAEIYAPIRNRFQWIVLFLGAVLALGMVVLRRQLRPMLRTVEAAHARATEDNVRLEAAMESSLDAFFNLEAVRDATGNVADVRFVILNTRAEEVLERPRADVVGRCVGELFPAWRTSGLLDHFIRVIETGAAMVEERESIERPGRWYHVQGVKMGDGLALTVRDITDAHAAGERIRHQAFHDPLTGIANRAGFEVAQAQAMVDARRHGHEMALLLLDLDGFKQVNDTLGHAVGDMLLREMARRLRDCLRPSDTVARLGGDEFVVLLPKLHDPAGAEVVARNVLACVAEPMQLEGHCVAVTASVGVSRFPRDAGEASQLLKAADTAMYRAKRRGRNAYAVFEDADTEATRDAAPP